MISFRIIPLFFWVSLFFIFYAYIGYPLLLMFLSFFKNRPVKKMSITPNVSFIITAYNEEKRIQKKIENTLKQDYPAEKLEIIVASDCSTDQTDSIVSSFRNSGVKLIRSPERKGKENAQKYAVEASVGEILVFSDVATVLNVDGVRNIVKNFHDSSIGCVSSIDKFVDEVGYVSGEGAYVRYEMYLRTLESKVNSLVGLSGSFFAAKREACQPWDPNIQSDFNTLLNTIKIGLRGVLDPNSVGFYSNISDEKKEFDRKIRTVLRGISVFMKNLRCLNPLEFGMFSWQLFSHKLCRWLVPFFLIAIFLSNLFLISISNLYLLSFLGQSLFYTMVFYWMISGTSPFMKIFKIPHYFFMANISILIAWYRYLKGDRLVTWKPSQR